MPAQTLQNRAPLPKARFMPLPPSAISPTVLPRAHVLSEAEAHALLSAPGIPSNKTIRKLLRYYSDTADKRVPVALMNTAKTLLADLPNGRPLSPARASDVGDLMHMALYLYNLTGQSALITLCHMLRGQAPDWMSTFHVFPQVRPVKDAPFMDTDAYFRVHGATIAASLKTPALQALSEGGLKNETAPMLGIEKLLRYHGAAHGLFNADPLLQGTNPACRMDDDIVREMLYSLHVLLCMQGDARFGDLMEHILYNALPAARGGQAANQLVPAAYRESTVSASDAVASICMATADEGLAMNLYTPCEVRWIVGGAKVRLSTLTNYPAEDTVRIKVGLKEPAKFPLHLRIPAFAQGATAFVGDTAYDAVPGTFSCIERLWAPGDEVLLTLPLPITHKRFARQSLSIMRGPVTYALPLSSPEDAFSYALLSDAPQISKRENALPEIAVRVAPTADFKRSGDVAGILPIAPTLDASGAQTVKLVPYGETNARIAQFPAGFAYAEAGNGEMERE